MGYGPLRVFLIAGEPSGDRLGAALMQGLKQLQDGIAFTGVGGPLMTAQGLESQFDMTELSVMGLAEILPKYRALKRRIAQTARAILDQSPDVVVTIDSPDFCVRVAKLVKAARPSQKIVHYVAPSVWAWRPKRADKMRGLVDHVLALLPFEPPLMEQAGVPCTFVGHPVVAENIATDTQATEFRAEMGIGDAPLILCLPGSRRGEVSRLSWVFGAALALVVAEKPNARVVIPCAAPVADLVRDLTADWPVPPILLDPRNDPQALAQKRSAFRAADVALAASGTVSLELAANGTPMVIGYKMNWLTHKIISAMALIDTVTLVNLVSKTRVVPEFLGPACKPHLIAAAILIQLDHPDQQRPAMQVTMALLGQGDDAPGLRAARAVLKVVNAPG